MTESYDAVQLKDFQTHLNQRLNEFRKQNHLCDVSVEVNGKFYPCHRVILTAASPFFEAILNEMENPEKNSKNAVISLKEIEPIAVEEILNAIYSSSLNLVPSNVYFIFKASHIMKLEMIKNACVSWMIKNNNIHYLINACLLAKELDEKQLYDKCVNSISSNLVRWSKTDPFKDIPFDVLNLILSRCDSTKNESIMLLMIIKWSKYHKTSSNDVQILLDAAKLKGKIVSTPILSDLITSADDDIFTYEKQRTMEKKQESSFSFDFSLYLNAVNVKSGVTGWSSVKINEALDQYVMTNFHVTENAGCRKVVNVGTKFYCFEYCNTFKKNSFCCYDENCDKVELKLPAVINSSFDLVVVDRIIYLVTKGARRKSIWAYDCALNVWKESFLQWYESVRVTNIKIKCARHRSSTTPYSLFNYCGCKNEYEKYNVEKSALHAYENTSSAFSSSDGILYVIAKKEHYHNYILSFDHRCSEEISVTNVHFQHRNAAFCAFDNKIMVSGSDDDNVLRKTCNIFDITAKQWQSNVASMNFDRANHNLFHLNGFVYAIENGRPSICNEKYDVKSNTWINIPSLPKRILVENTNDVLVVSTADVIGVDVIPFQ